MSDLASDHDRLDARSLALHRRVAQKLRADPSLLETARANLRRWQGQDGMPPQALAEWGSVLDGPFDHVVFLLTDRSELATRLRQSSPFCGILSEGERRAIHESYTTRTYHPGREPDRG